MSTQETTQASASDDVETAVPEVPPRNKNVRKRAASLPIEVVRSGVPLEAIPQLGDFEIFEAKKQLAQLARSSRRATERATAERQKLIDAAIDLAVSNRKWGHVTTVAETMDMSRTQLARLIEMRHPGFLATVSPDSSSKWGRRGAHAPAYAGKTD